ncbi:MAG TPA: isoprenylcysteine carboxylmethyltransferase family protein [bacterium]|nr:isoprenylcysteine carboxylmethyltransferase family protein [bacterium]
MGKPDTAGVVAPPPLIYLAAVVVGLALRRLAPAPVLPRPLAYELGVAVIVIAVALALWGVREMRRAGTSESTAVPTRALVTTGPFRLSRNPLYVSLTLCYLGIMLAAQALWGLALVVVVLFVMRRGVIDREERYMSRRFGDAYLRYRKQVRRWM